MTGLIPRPMDVDAAWIRAQRSAAQTELREHLERALEDFAQQADRRGDSAGARAFRISASLAGAFVALPPSTPTPPPPSVRTVRDMTPAPGEGR